MQRDNQGRILLDDYQKLNNYITGRKEKVWLKKDGKKFLFKTGASNFEIFAEIISSELAQQCGFRTAFYDFAILDGKSGVITPSFLNMGDMIISGEKYLQNASEIALQNNLYMDFRKNSIENILNAVALQENQNIDDIMSQLIRMWCFDLAIMESDRNKTNWSIIKKMNGNVELAPIYDCSTMARMNTDIDNIVSNLRYEQQIYSIIDSIKYSLVIHSTGNENFYEDLGFLCTTFPSEMEEIIDCLQSINVFEAIKKIEDRVNNDLENKNFKIPRNISFWLNKVIGIRVNMMKCILENSKSKSKN